MRIVANTDWLWWEVVLLNEITIIPFMGLEPFMDCLTNKGKAFTSFNGWMRIIVKNIKMRSTFVCSDRLLH